MKKKKMKKKKTEDLIESCSDGRLFDTYIRHLGKEPVNIKAAKEHIQKCSWCKTHLSMLKIAEESGLYVSHEED